MTRYRRHNPASRTRNKAQFAAAFPDTATALPMPLPETQAPASGSGIDPVRLPPPLVGPVQDSGQAPHQAAVALTGVAVFSLIAAFAMLLLSL